MVEHTLRDCQSRAPLVPQDIQTDAAVGVDVGMVDASCERNLGRLEWVVRGEVDVKEEDTSSVWGVVLVHVLVLVMFIPSACAEYHMASPRPRGQR